MSGNPEQSSPRSSSSRASAPAYTPTPPLVDIFDLMLRNELPSPAVRRKSKGKPRQRQHQHQHQHRRANSEARTAALDFGTSCYLVRTSRS